MFIFFEVASPQSLEAMVMSIPESAGLLVCGIGLAVVAVLLRSFFARAEKPKGHENAKEV